MGSVCTDGAPAMIGHQPGFVALMNQVAPHIVSNHCAIHKYALACKTLPLELKSVLDSVVKAVNLICGRAVNYRPFKAFLGQPWKGALAPSFPHQSAMVIAGKSALPNLSLKLPCSFVSMGQWNLLQGFEMLVLSKNSLSHNYVFWCARKK